MRIRFLLIVFFVLPSCAFAEEKESRVTRIYFDSNVETPPPTPEPEALIILDNELGELCAEGTLEKFPHTEIKYSITVEDAVWGNVWYANILSHWSGHMIRIYCWQDKNSPPTSVFVKGEYLNNVEGELP